MKIFLSTLVVGILILSGFGTAALNYNIENYGTKMIENKNLIGEESAFTHTVLGEYATATWCSPCHYAHGALKQLYAEQQLDFYYVTYVCDMNPTGYSQCTGYYNFYGYPTLWWDGGYKVNVGASSVPGAKATYTTSITSSGNRQVSDIDISLDVTWLGPGNPTPEDNGIEEPVDGCLTWTNTDMNIDVTIDNNEATTYGGHIRVFICEKVSSMGWMDTAQNLYTMPFLDWAFNEPLSISSGGSWSDTMTWDGTSNGFPSITEDNTIVIAAVYNDEWHQGYSYPPSSNPFDAYYVDECVAVDLGAGINNDPKAYDVYFGDSNPPPKVSSNQSTLEYYPSGILDFNTTYYWKIVVWNNQGASITGPLWSFTTRGNDAPNIPSNPSPSNGAMDVDVEDDLSWTCTDPNGDTVTYDVYFGTSSSPPKVSNNQSGTSYNPPGILNFDTTYYWQIVAWDEYDYTTSGPIWSFTTEENDPPNTPTNPDPDDGATDIYINTDISWAGGDPNPGDTVTYDVYFGSSNPPSLVDEDLSETTYDPGTMNLNTTYYWQIVSEDSHGLITTGPIWHFTTELEPNNQPIKPDIDGPNSGKPNTAYDFTFNSVDPDGDDVKYHIDWGDGNSETTSFATSGTNVIASHTWTAKGTYIITAYAEDEFGALSEETTFQLIIDKSKTINNPFLNWLQNHPNMFPILQLLIQRLNPTITIHKHIKTSFFRSNV